MGPYDITGIDPVKLLQALYRHALPVQGTAPELSTGEAVAAMAAATNEDVLDFGDVGGRPINVSINAVTLYRPQLFDALAGDGACERAIAEAQG